MFLLDVFYVEEVSRGSYWCWKCYKQQVKIGLNTLIGMGVVLEDIAEGVLAWESTRR